MRPVSVEHSHRAFREGLQRTVDQRQQQHVTEWVDSATVHRTAAQVFEDLIQRNPTLGEPAVFDRIAQRAEETGLTKHDLTAAFQAAAHHVALAHEFRAQHEFRDKLSTASDPKRGSLPGRLAQHLGLSALSASFYDSSVPSNLDISGTDAETAALAESAVEQQIVKKRYDLYLELGGEGFRQTMARYQAGELTYQELLDHDSYQVGIRRITEALPIADDFVLDQANGISIDTWNEDVKTAIRRHLGFILRSEIAQLAELRQLPVMSVPDFPEYTNRATEHPKDAISKVKQFATSGLPMRLARLLRVAATNATAWSFGGAYIGGQLALVHLHDPNQWVTAGCTVVGAALTGAVVRLARAGSEAPLRQKQRRTEIGLGTVTERASDLDRQLVPDADLFRTRLLDQVQQLEHATEQGGTVDEVITALADLYWTIADVRSRLRRSREGNKPPHSDHHTGPLRIERPKGKPLAHAGPLRVERPAGEPVHHGGPLRIVRPDDDHGVPDRSALERDRAEHDQAARDQHAWADQSHVEHAAAEPERFDPKHPQQDYINFGIENRFTSQQQLAEALNQALSVLERVQPPAGKLRQDWTQRMKVIEQQAEQHMDEIQAAVDEEVRKFEGAYTLQALDRGVTAGMISRLAIVGLEIAGLPYPPAKYIATIAADWMANRTPQTIQPSKYTAGAPHDSLVAQDRSGRTIEDLSLPDWRDTTETARTERLDRTRAQREQTAREHIRGALDAVEQPYGRILDAMQTLVRAIQGAGAISPDQMAVLQTRAPELADIVAQRQGLEDVLRYRDEDFTYRDIDAAEDGRLARLVAEVDALATLGDQVTTDITRQLHMLNQEATRVRQIPDTDLNVVDRKQQLLLVVKRMTELRDSAAALHPGVIDQPSFDNVTSTVDRYHDQIDGAITVLTLRQYMSINPSVGTAMERLFLQEGLIDSSDQTQVGRRAALAQRVAEQLLRQAPTAAPDELVALGFVTSGRIARVNERAILDFIHQA